MSKCYLSVLVITHNAERTLAKCLSSIPQGCELIVVDSGSTDSSREIAAIFGARVFVNKWEGFAAQRNYAVTLASSDWLLFLDSDEWLTASSGQEVIEFVRNNLVKRAGVFRRLSYFNGRLVKHGDWANDWVARLVHRNNAIWVGEEPHPVLDVKSLELIKLKNPLFHDPYSNIEDFERKIQSYAKQWAYSAYQKGTKVNALAYMTRAFWRWLRGFILRGGFLDGYAGAKIALMNARMVILKFRELKHLNHISKFQHEN